MTALKAFIFPAMLIMVTSSSVKALDITGRMVTEAMSPEQRAGLMLGLIEATAYARWLRDNKNEDGMKCMLDWFNNGGAALEEIMSVLKQRPDYPPAPVVHVLANKRCPSK